VSDEDATDAVGRVLDRVEQLPFEVDAISRTAATTKSASFDVLGPLLGGSPGHLFGGKRLLHQLDTHASYWTEYAMYKGKDRELQFPHAVCVSYHNGDRGENGEVVRGYVACDLTDRTPKQVVPLSQTLSHVKPATEPTAKREQPPLHQTR